MLTVATIRCSRAPDAGPRANALCILRQITNDAPMIDALDEIDADFIEGLTPRFSGSRNP
jgi:hypothetical protein